MQFSSFQLPQKAIRLSHFLKVALRPRGLRSFLNQSNRQSKILDVGCGNQSSIFIKGIVHNCNVYGIDISDYNQTNESKNLYDQYIITTSERFANAINELQLSFDLIISNHNIEHCDDPKSTFSAMVDRLAPGGSLFVASPSIYSVEFPNRSGTLNFYDDHTHRSPVDLIELLDLESHQLDQVFYSNSYRPVFWRMVGLFNEYFSRKNEKVMLGTWDYYGFEQILWAKKKHIN